jgi:hypothetical protein
VYLASSPAFSGTSLPNAPHVCRDYAKLKAIVSPSQRSLKIRTHDFATLLPVCHAKCDGRRSVFRLRTKEEGWRRRSIEVTRELLSAAAAHLPPRDERGHGSDRPVIRPAVPRFARQYLNPVLLACDAPSDPPIAYSKCCPEPGRPPLNKPIGRSTALWPDPQGIRRRSWCPWSGRSARHMSARWRPIECMRLHTQMPPSNLRRPTLSRS